jgi:hypothetical protein
MSEVPSVSLAPVWDPAKPPQRVYIGGFTYRLATPSVTLPLLPGLIKSVWNWAHSSGRIAKNILHTLYDSAAPTSTPAFLTGVSDAHMSGIASAPMWTYISSNWSLVSVTSYDAGFPSSTAGVSTHAALPGLSGNVGLPPQAAVVWSWVVEGTWRGGKPRTYIPGLDVTTTTTSGGSQLSVGVANALRTSAENFRTAVDAASVSSHVGSLGMPSYYHAHAVRPTPLFYGYVGVRVHERLDSQRRRNGRESTFPVVP